MQDVANGVQKTVEIKYKTAFEAQRLRSEIIGTANYGFINNQEAVSSRGLEISKVKPQPTTERGGNEWQARFDEDFGETLDGRNTLDGIIVPRAMASRAYRGGSAIPSSLGGYQRWSGFRFEEAGLGIYRVTIPDVYGTKDPPAQWTVPHGQPSKGTKIFEGGTFTAMVGWNRTWRTGSWESGQNGGGSQNQRTDCGRVVDDFVLEVIRAANVPGSVTSVENIGRVFANHAVNGGFTDNFKKTNPPPSGFRPALIASGQSWDVIKHVYGMAGAILIGNSPINPLSRNMVIGGLFSNETGYQRAKKQWKDDRNQLADAQKQMLYEDERGLSTDATQMRIGEIQAELEDNQAGESIGYMMRNLLIPRRKLTQSQINKFKEQITGILCSP